MAEALAVIGVVASIVQLVDFGSKILSRLNEFQSTAGEIPQSFCHIKSELPVLLDSLRHTKEAIEAGSIRDGTKKALLPAIEGCHVQIKALDDVLLKVLPTSGDSWRKKSRKAVSILYYEGRVEKIARVIRNYIQTLTFYHATTSSTSRPLTEMIVRERQDLRLKFEIWLKPPNVREFHQRQIETKLNGTCEWISMHPIFLRWKSTTASSVSDRLLCIYGTHGCGKTVLASAIAQSLKTQGQRILFFSFSGIDACRQTLDGLIRAMLWQLLQEPTCTQSLDIMANLMLRGQPLTSELWDVYNRVVALGGEEEVYWVIDGIDECGEPMKKVFHQVLELLTNHKTARVILSGRPYIIETVGDATDNKIQISPCLTKPDLDAFIDAEISKSKILCHSVLREHVAKGLRQKSDGMFLWVKLMIDDLRKASSRYEVTERLQNLPHGLQEAYRMLLSRLVDRLDRFELRLLRCILAFTIVSCRTMKLEELQYAQALQYMSALCTSTAPLLQDYLLEEPTQKILEVCGGLVNITNGFVNLVHVSVKEFLTRPEDEWQRGDDRRIIELRIDEEESHHSFNSICIDYLRMGGYGSPLQNPDIFSTHETRYPFLDYSSRFMIQHFNRSHRASSATISKMNAFLEADICVSWMEYFAIVLVEDGLSGAQMQSLAEFVSRLEKGGYAQEFALKLKTRIEQEFSIRKQKYGESDSRTEQLQMIWNLVEESANVDAPVKATVPIISDSIPDDSMARVSQLITVINSAKALPIHCQFDFLLKLQRQLQRAEALTDPLELLFRLILGKAAIVPLYALLAIASFCKRLARYDKALEFYLAAFAKIENREVLNKFFILHEIGWVRSAQGQYLEAEKVYRQALQGREKALGVEHTSTLTTVYRLGVLYARQGKLDEAEKMYQRALQGREKALGAEHTSTLTTAYQLGVLYSRQGNLDEAEKMYQRALRGMEKALGAKHTSTLTTVHSLGVLYTDQGKLDEAEKMCQRALQGEEKALGAEHTLTLTTVHSLGFLYAEQGKLDEAEKMYQRALQGEEKALSAEHTSTLTTVHCLGVLYADRGKLDEAEKMYQRALQGEEKALGAEHTLTLTTAHRLGVLYARQGKLDEAEKMYQRALQGRENALGTEHTPTLATSHRLGILYGG